jgi:hypothetical protein
MPRTRERTVDTFMEIIETANLQPNIDENTRRVIAANIQNIGESVLLELIGKADRNARLIVNVFAQAVLGRDGISWLESLASITTCSDISASKAQTRIKALETNPPRRGISWDMYSIAIIQFLKSAGLITSVRYLTREEATLQLLRELSDLVRIDEAALQLKLNPEQGEGFDSVGDENSAVLTISEES